LLIQNGLKFFAPLDIHIDLHRRFSSLIRIGYANRNPLRPEFWPSLNSKINSFDQYEDQYKQQPDRLPSTAAGFNILGPSGSGKSFSTERVLFLFPQVIHHSNYLGQFFTQSQIVWVKLDCPFDGNPRGLCIQFFKAVDCILGTSYYQSYVRDRRLVDELLSDMATVAANHFIGVLVIDEIQRLSLAKSGGANKMLNFFVQLINEIGVPVVLIGNYKALSIFSGDFSQMRRGTGQGDLIWDLMEKDKQWELFVESLWRFQYTRKSCKHDDITKKSSDKNIPTLADVLYEETQGITDFAVKVYMFAQERAIDSGREVVNAATIRSAATDKLRIPREVLMALKTNDKAALARYEDLYYEAFKSYLYQQPEGVQLTGKINSAPEVKVLLESSPQIETEGESNSLQSTTHPSVGSSSEIIKTPPNRNRKTQKPISKEGVGIPIKGMLPALVAPFKKGEGSAAYEVLKHAGFIRPASEYL
jgi:hypothetical protein